MKRSSSRAKAHGKKYVRISLSIPRDLWPFFERQRRLPKHAGNRSSFVRSLIIEEMQDVKARQFRQQVKAEQEAKDLNGHKKKANRKNRVGK